MVDGCSETWWTGCKKSLRDKGLRNWFQGRQGTLIDIGDMVMAEEDLPQAVGGSGPEGHGVTVQGLAKVEELALERDFSLALHPAHLAGWILDRRQALREGTRTDPVSPCRRLHVQRLMRPLLVIDLAPGIEAGLRLAGIEQRPPCQQFRLQGPMEALVLSLGLRMVRTRMRDLDAQPDQPQGKR